MAESEEDDDDSMQLKYIQLEQNSSNADNDNNQDSFIIVVDNNTQKAMRIRNGTPKRNSAQVRVEQQRQQSNTNQKADDEYFEFVMPERREATKRVLSVLKEPGLRLIATKRSREVDETVEKQVVTKKPSPSIVVNKDSTNKITPSAQPVPSNTDLLVSSTEKTDSNNEETYFALSLVGILKRLSPHKRALAKCHILSFLTELEYGPSELPK